MESEITRQMAVSGIILKNFVMELWTDIVSSFQLAD